MGGLQLSLPAGRHVAVLTAQKLLPPILIAIWLHFSTLQPSAHGQQGRRMFAEPPDKGKLLLPPTLPQLPGSNLIGTDR